MSILTTYQLQSCASTLQIALHDILTTSDLFLFLSKITEATQVLTSLRKSIRNQRNSFGLALPSMLLVQVFTWLPPSCKMYQRVNRCWHRALTSPLAEKYLWRTARFEQSWQIINPYISALTGSNLIICGWGSSTLEIWNLQGILQATFQADSIHRMAGNKKNFITAYRGDHCNPKIKLKTVTNEFIKEWETPSCHKLAMNQEFIFLLANTFWMYIYSLDGTLIRKWSMLPYAGDINKFTVSAENEVFATFDTYVRVFSEHGVLLREFGTPGTGPGQFQRAWGIGLSGNQVYVVDNENHRLNIFTRKGQFLSVVECPQANPNLKGLGDLHIHERCLYVLDHRGNLVLVYRI